MRRATVFMSVAAVMFSAATALAQKSFAGHWVVQPGSSTPTADGGGLAAGGGGGRGGGGAGGGGRAGGAGRGNGGALGGEFWVEQDAKMMTVIRINTTTGDTTRTVYHLDGTPSKNTPVGGPGGAGGAGGRGAGRGGAGGNAGGNAAADTAGTNEQTSTAKWNKDELEITTSGRGGNTILRIYFVKNALFVQTVRPGNNGAPPTETLTIYDKKK
jgi:hypothetical protein